MIESLVYQRPVGLLQQYEFLLTWNKDGEIAPFIAIVTVSHRDGVTTIVDLSVEGDLPEGFTEVWDAAWALKQVHFELGEELNRLKQTETF
jgi:hypothetical protein